MFEKHEYVWNYRNKFEHPKAIQAVAARYFSWVWWISCLFYPGNWNIHLIHWWWNFSIYEYGYKFSTMQKTQFQKNSSESHDLNCFHMQFLSNFVGEQHRSCPSCAEAHRLWEQHRGLPGEALVYTAHGETHWTPSGKHTRNSWTWPLK